MGFLQKRPPHLVLIDAYVQGSAENTSTSQVSILANCLKKWLKPLFGEMKRISGFATESQEHGYCSIPYQCITIQAGKNTKK